VGPATTGALPRPAPWSAPALTDIHTPPAPSHATPPPSQTPCSPPPSLPDRGTAARAHALAALGSAGSATGAETGRPWASKSACSCRANAASAASPDPCDVDTDGRPGGDRGGNPDDGACGGFADGFGRCAPAEPRRCTHPRAARPLPQRSEGVGIPRSRSAPLPPPRLLLKTRGVRPGPTQGGGRGYPSSRRGGPEGPKKIGVQKNITQKKDPLWPDPKGAGGPAGNTHPPPGGQP